MKTEKYRVKCPKRVMFGDPWYFKNYKDRPGERERLVVNYTPLQSFAAGVVLQEKEETDSSEGVQKFLVFYFAPEEDIDTYMDEKMYSLQKVFQREILVDTACYVIGIEGRHEVWHTGVNGVCGIFTEYYREEDGEKVTDAGILLIAAPDSVTFEDMRCLTEYLFKEVQLIGEEEK